VRVLVVLDEGDLPSDVLRRRTDLDRTDEAAHRR
jgi:hypothetical protein